LLDCPVCRRDLNPFIHQSTHPPIHFPLMSGQAQITSVEAIAAFRADLVVYLAQVKPLLDEVASEVMHTRSWLQDDRRRFWQQELRVRGRRLEEAKQELFNASISRMGEAKSFQQMAVQRAQREVQAAEEKLTILRKWDHELDDRSAPLVKQMEQLHGFLGVEMAKAVAYLDQALKALDAYQSVAPRPAEKTQEPK
jgi:hypothetical protein